MRLTSAVIMCIVATAGTRSVPAAVLIPQSPSGLPPGFSYHAFDLEWPGIHPPFLQWISTSATFTLTDPSLSFYQAQGGDAITQLMPPKPSDVLADPALAWDTFVSSPYAFPNVTADAQHTPPAILPELTAVTESVIEALWFAPLAPQRSPYAIARFTIRGPIGLELAVVDTGFPVGVITGQSTTFPAGSGGPEWFEITIYAVPEPAGWMAVALGAAALLRRR